MPEIAHNTKQPNFWDKIWKDRQGKGKIVIYQMPNIPLAAWAILTVISLMTNGTIANITSMIASFALLGWAAWEVWSGVNYFRRGLGLVIFLFSILSVYKNIFG
jgi:hypothetical protein